MIFIFLFYLVQSQDCVKYTCKTNSQSFTDGTCIAYISSVYYVSPCTTGVCPISLGISNSSCTTSPTTLQQLYPGNKCTSDSNCTSKSCLNGLCAGNLFGQNCVVNTDCDPDLYCSNAGICDNLIPIQSFGCNNDNNCVNNAGCNVTENNGVCLSYFSIKPGEYVSDCSYPNINLLCTSGMCGSVNEQYVCLEAVENVAPKPYICSPGGSCLSKPDKNTGVVLSTDCDCGLSSKGYAYCNLFTGDDYALNFLFYMKSWLTSSNVRSCNTDMRLDLTCLNDF